MHIEILAMESIFKKDAHFGKKRLNCLNIYHLKFLVRWVDYECIAQFQQ